MSRILLRLLALSLALLCLFSFVGCEEKTPESDSLYQFNYVTTKDISRFGSVPAGAYKNITITLGDDCRFTDTTVSEWIAKTLSENPAYTYITDRAVEKGDTIRFYYTASVDGVVVKSHVSTGDDPKDPITLTLNTIDYLNIDGWNDGLVGATCGIPALFTLKAPDNYGVVDMRGKEVDFAVTVVGIREEVYLEALTADYVKNILGYTSEKTTDDEVLADFLNYLEVNLKASAEANYKSKTQEQVILTLIRNLTLNGYPEQDLNYQYNSLYAYYESLREYDNLQYYYAYGEQNHFSSFEDYLRLCFNLSADADPLPELTKQAEDVVIQNLVIACVFHQERMEISESEYLAFRDEVIASYVENGYITEEEALATIDEAMLYNELMWERVLAYILGENNCTILYSN